MSHTTIYFISKAKNLEQAEKKVMEYLEGEHFFDYFNVLPEESGPLAEKRAGLNAFLDGYDWRTSADDLLSLAEKYKAKGYLSQYGYCLIDAGKLFAQCLAIGMYVFNIDAGDYSIPPKDKGWQVIAADFHY
jgi:hypothetical protein